MIGLAYTTALMVIGVAIVALRWSVRENRRTIDELSITLNALGSVLNRIEHSTNNHYGKGR